ncbi:hypothetical protein KY289_008476 [Solanum tuberosum]|nr:hypothetical protein KY289_008476 [Solanum tuberosum]
MSKFSYNLQRSESIGHTPFELATGQQPQTPYSLPAAFQGKSLGAYHLAKGWEEQLDTTKSYLDNVAKKMMKLPTTISVPQTTKKVFHASVLKPYHEDKDDLRRNQSRRAPITVTASHDREIKVIIDYQAKRKRGQQACTMFLVHWKGQTLVEATWERYEDLWQFKDRI